MSRKIEYFGIQPKPQSQQTEHSPKTSPEPLDPLYNLIEHIHPAFEKVLRLDSLDLEALCAAPTFVGWRLGVSDRFLYEALLPRINEKLPYWRVLVPIRRSFYLGNLRMGDLRSIKDLNLTSVLEKNPTAAEIFDPQHFLTLYDATQQEDASQIIDCLLKQVEQVENNKIVSEPVIVLMELFEPIEAGFIKQLRHTMRYGTPLRIIPWLHAEIATTPHELLDQFRNHIVMLPSHSELEMMAKTSSDGIKLEDREKLNLAMLSGPCVNTVRKWRTLELMDVESLDTDYPWPITVPKKLIDFEIILSEDMIHAHSLGRSAHARFPYSKLEKIKARYAALKKSTTDGDLHGFGELLFDTLFVDDIKTLWIQTQENVNNSNQGVRLRLDSTDPKLVRVPWEYLFDKLGEKFLALEPDCSIIRARAVLSPQPQLQVRDQIRFLAVSSSPAQLPPIRTEEEKRNIKRILKRSRHIKQNYSLQASQHKLQVRLSRYDPHILHYVGHGYFKRSTAEAALPFQGKNDETNYIDVETFRHMLQGAKSLRLVVLNACRTADMSATTRHISGFAQNLAQKNLPAIVAMQSSISDEASYWFAQGFYEALSETGSVERGMVAGRQFISDYAKSNEWGLPVLWLRAEEGTLFDVSNVP